MKTYDFIKNYMIRISVVFQDVGFASVVLKGIESIYAFRNAI
jgi:hypothetical protein